MQQRGTGLHIDSHPYNLWQTENKDGTYGPLEWFRVFQSFVALSDGSKEKHNKDGGLEVVPGFFAHAESYYKNHPQPTSGRDLYRWGPYNTKPQRQFDGWMFPLVQKAQRIPKSWDPSALPSLSHDDAAQMTRQIARHHALMDYEPIKKGDFVVWDIRTPHQNSDKNECKEIRSVFYHSYMLAQPTTINARRIEAYANCRTTKQHPAEFPKKWTDIEHGVTTVPLESDLSRCLYNETEWTDDLCSQLLNKHQTVLTERHVAFFKLYGYVVIENLFDEQIVNDLNQEVASYARQCGCDFAAAKTKSISERQWSKIGGKFGRMVELFWQPTQQKIRIDEQCYAVIASLGQQTWQGNAFPFCHPFVDAHFGKLWLYLDRVNVSIPDHWLENMNNKQKITNYFTQKRKSNSPDNVTKKQKMLPE